MASFTVLIRLLGNQSYWAIITIIMSDKEIYQNSSKKRTQKNYRGVFGDYCCIPGCQSAFYDVKKVKTVFPLFKL